jgi:hypothetical protein
MRRKNNANQSALSCFSFCGITTYDIDDRAISWVQQQLQWQMYLQSPKNRSKIHTAQLSHVILLLTVVLTAAAFGSDCSYLLFRSSSCQYFIAVMASQ